VSNHVNPTPGRSAKVGFALVAAAALAVVLLTFWRTWTPGFGLTRFIQIGHEFNRRGTAVYRATPKYMDPEPRDSWGFDGQYYAEIALEPLLRDPALKTALDDPQYRAHRILLPWLSWIAGLGRPYWVLNAYAAMNGVFWLGYLVILWVLFRPYGWAGVGGFAAMLLTCGVVESMYRALTDFPAFVLMTLAAMAGGIGGGCLLGLSGLTREINLLGLPALLEWKRPWSRETLRRNAAIALLSVVPLLLWWIYVRWRLPVHTSEVGANIDWPFRAIVERLGEVLAAARAGQIDWTQFYKRGTEVHALLTVIAILTQCAFVVTHRKWENRIWRLGAVFVPFFLCISMNVWGGYSYFTVTRHALPITLAFNLGLAARPSRRWFVWFLLGNCFVPAGIFDFMRFGAEGPELAPYVVEAMPPLNSELTVDFASGWSGEESNANKDWHWATARRAVLVLDNASARPVEARLDFTAVTLRRRELRVQADGRTVWIGRLGAKPESTPVRTLRFAAPPGKTRVVLSSPQPPSPPSRSDPRSLDFMVNDLLVTAGPPP
jgi:hypothetical protein